MVVMEGERKRRRDKGERGFGKEGERVILPTRPRCRGTGFVNLVVYSYSGLVRNHRRALCRSARTGTGSSACVRACMCFCVQAQAQERSFHAPRHSREKDGAVWR